MPRDELIAPKRWLAFVRGASPGRQWNTDAREHAKAMVEQYAAELVANVLLSDPTLTNVRRIRVEDVNAAIDRAKDAHTLWLEERIENHARACPAFKTELDKARRLKRGGV